VIEWFWWVPGIYPAQTETKPQPVTDLESVI